MILFYMSAIVILEIAKKNAESFHHQRELVNFDD